MHAQSIAFTRQAPSRPPLADDAEEIKLMGVAKRFARDQEIFGEGESAELVYKVVSGAVRCFRVLADGRRQISEFYLPGDVFGVEAGPDRSCNAEAVSETVVIQARRSQLLADDFDQGAKMWRLAVRELQRSQDHILTLGRRAAGERVASFLVDLATRTEAGDDLELPMSRQDMADYLGLTIETVSRTFTQLQAQNLIRLSGCRHVSLADRGALHELCE
ncbi:MAG: helix-turn-helix domain-containing protein [Caulobacterales bacterium]